MLKHPASLCTEPFPDRPPCNPIAASVPAGLRRQPGSGQPLTVYIASRFLCEKSILPSAISPHSASAMLF